MSAALWSQGYVGTVNVVLAGIALLALGWFVYESSRTPCNRPIEYRIGTVDSRFGLSEDQLRRLLAESETIWEESTGYNLLTYNAESALAVNLLFDERQQEFLAQQRLRQEIANQSGSFEELEARFAQERVAYEERVSALNQEIERYNTQGGAPPAEYQRLEAERQAIQQQAAELNALANQLNALAGELNVKIDTVNADVGKIFDQGEYTGEVINIYQYEDEQDLQLVLAHELGHALGIDHVENSESIMHYLLKDQDLAQPTLSSEDRQALEAVCRVSVRDIFLPPRQGTEIE